MHRTVSYINKIASKLPSPPEKAPEFVAPYPDEELELSTNEFYDMITNGDTTELLETFYSKTGPNDTIVIDVRTPQEILECQYAKEIREFSKARYLSISVGNLTHMNRTFLEKSFGIRRNQTIVCLCRSGKRSLMAQKHLSNLGFDAFSVHGGVQAYASSTLRRAGSKLMRV